MQRSVLLIILSLFYVIDSCTTNIIEQNDQQNESPQLMAQAVTAFDYDYANEPRRYHSYRHQEKSQQLATTPRPFVSYWQNLMKNVRLSVPTITWNVTNPLANLFHAGHEEFAPVEEVQDDEEYYQRRHRNKKRRKQHHTKRHRKHKRPLESTDEEQQYALENLAAQNMIEQYPVNNNIDLNTPMYFYDPKTDAYYAVQRVEPMGAFAEGTVFNPRTTPEFGEQQAPQTANEVISNEGDVDVDADTDDEDENHLPAAKGSGLNAVLKNESSMATKAEQISQTSNIEQPKNNFLDPEALRNVLGTFMRDDLYNRQKQRSKEKKRANNFRQSRPRQEPNYYFLLDVS